MTKNPTFDEILGLKKRIVQYYRKHKCFEPNAIDRFAKIFSTHKDMIQAMSFMKYELNKDEFTGADFEEIYNN